MCGIFGYSGNIDAKKILLEGLKKLEYRGYDSVGIALRNECNDTNIFKVVGKIDSLKELTKDNKIKGNIGIGHTRWATHGAATINNAHPIGSNDNNIIGVHNGIIENYQELKDKLLNKGYIFNSSTDTEVIINLVDYYYKKYKIGPIDAINKALLRARGTYALALIFKDYPNQVWFTKKGSPLLVAKKDDESFLASDSFALIEYTNKIYYVEDYECGVLEKGMITFFDLNGNDITNTKHEIILDIENNNLEKGNYPHFMIKEIEEQPKVLRHAINHYIKNDDIDFSRFNIDIDLLKNIEEIYIIGCGSAYNVGISAEYIIEDITGIEAKCYYASEFKYRNKKLNKNSVALIISQSGETKDTYEAMLKLKEESIKTISIINNKSSIIAKNSDYNLYTYAGPEIAVATTKAYSCELIVLYLFSLYLAKAKNNINANEYKGYIRKIKEIPNKVEEILNNKEEIQKLSLNYLNQKTIFFIGRGIDYSTALEGALKLKEVSYINANAYASGELKHGPMSLVDADVSIISIITQEQLFDKSISNMIEINSRGGNILAIGSDKNKKIEYASENIIYLPKTDDLFMPSLSIIPLQLLAYYVSVAKGIDPDKPKNLAKAVTVE